MSKSFASRRRSVPWIQRWARPFIGAIAGLGILNTGYITLTKLSNAPTACPTGGCEQVLSSPYATVFGLPLALYGLLAYLAMAIFALAPLAVNLEANKPLRTNLENWTWLLLFAGSTAMLVFSGYLMNIMVSQFVVPFGVNGICYFCIASALFALTLFILSLIGRAWEDIGQLFLIGIVVAMVTLVGSLGIYAGVKPIAAAPNAPTPTASPIENASGAAEIALAQHLKQTGAKMFGAYWCSHCHDQKELFGKEAFSAIPYVECAPDGVNAQTERCKAAGVEGFPTWQINGKNVEPAGTLTLDKLAELSGYSGSRAFRSR